MPFEKLKRKRTEKRKNRYVLPMPGLLILFMILMLFIAGAAFYLTQQMPPDTPTPSPTPTINPVQLFADICDATDGQYQIMRVSPEVQRQQRITPNEQHLLTIDERGVFLGTEMQPTQTRLFDPGIQFTIHPAPDSRFFALYGDSGLYIVDTLTAELTLISTDATYFDTWSDNGDYVIFREDAQFIIGHTDNGRTRALPPQYGYVFEFGWSPDARYLEVYYMDGTTPKIRILDMTTFDLIHPEGWSHIYGKPSWSPDGDTVAYVDYSGGEGEDGDFAYMVVINPSEKLTRKGAFFTAISDVTGSIHLIWSPDSQYIAVFQYDPDSFHYHLLVDSVKGQNRVYVADDIVAMPGISPEVPLHAHTDAYRKVTWSADSQTLYYWREPHDSDELSLYHLNIIDYFAMGTGNQIEPFSTHILTAPTDGFLYDPAGNYLFLTHQLSTAMTLTVLDPSGESVHKYVLENYYRSTGTLRRTGADSWLGRNSESGKSHIDLIILSENRVQPIIESPLNMGKVEFDPGNNYLMVTWSDKPQSDPSRRVFITWAAIDGSDPYTLKNDFKSVYDLLWSDDSEWLAYTYWRNDESQDDTGVEIVNTRTKQIIPLLTGAKDVDHKEYNPQTGIWTVWWTDFEKQAYVSVFDNEGQELFELKLRLMPFKPGRLSGIYHNYETTMIPSDTADVIAFKFRQYYTHHEHFVLLDVSDRQVMIESHINALGDPVWTSDGQYVMWTEYHWDGSATWLKVADTQGNLLHEASIGRYIPQLIWSDCN